MEASLPEWPRSPAVHKWELKKLVILWKNNKLWSDKQRQHRGGKGTTELIILSGFPGDQRKRLGYKLHCFAGITLGNKVTKAKWSSVLDTEVSSENSSQGHSKATSYLEFRGENLANIHERAEKRIFLTVFIQLSPKHSNAGVNKGAVVSSRCTIITLSVGFHHTRCISGPIMHRVGINLTTTRLLPPSDVFLFCARTPPVTSFPFHPVLRLVRYEVTSGQTMVRSGALQ